MYEKGIDSQLVVLNNIIHREFTTLDQSFYDYVAERLKQVIDDCGDRVPVLTGNRNSANKIHRHSS